MLGVAILISLSVLAVDVTVPPRVPPVRSPVAADWLQLLNQSPVLTIHPNLTPKAKYALFTEHSSNPVLKPFGGLQPPLEEHLNFEIFYINYE